MWIEMKTYSIQNGEDIDTILLNNINELNNAFELCAKDIQESMKETVDDMDFILLKTILTPLQIQKINSSKFLLKKNSEMYFVSCTNIKNQNGEYFSSIIGNLDENDRIIIYNGVVLKQFTIVNPKLLTVLVRPQNNSSVILFKHKISLEKSLLGENLSLLTGSGIYRISGIIKKVVLYDELMVLKLQCRDESKLKTLQYYHFFKLFKNVANNLSKSLVKYNIFSNEVDVLVITPSNDFTSLLSTQKICLSNLEVKNINDSDIFLLFIKGFSQNIKAVTIESGIVNFLRPPTRHFSIPVELKAEIDYCNFKKLTTDVQLVVNNSVVQLNTNTRKIYTKRQISYGTHLFSFFNSQSNIFLFNFENQSRQCLGLGRLISIEPNKFDKYEMVSGYCFKCSAFIQKRFLHCTTQSSNFVYTCPKCFEIVRLTFFFIMYFLYGNNESQAIKLYCYGQIAESVIREISITTITLNDYLSNPFKNKKVKKTISLLIRKKTKLKIVSSLVDNKNILLSLY